MILQKIDQAFGYDRVKHLLLTATLVAVVWLSFEVAWTMQAIRKQAQDNDYGQKINRAAEVLIDDGVKLGLLIDEGRGTVKSLNSKANQINPSTLEAELEETVRVWRAGVKQNLDDLHQTQAELKGAVQDSRPKIDSTLGHVEKASENLDLSTQKLYSFLSKPEVEKFIDDSLARGQSVIAHVDGATGNLEILTSNGASMTMSGSMIMNDLQQFAHSTLNPGPQPWYKKWILMPLKATAGYGLTAFQILKK